MVKHKYWYRLLEHYDKKRYVQNGLTIPFVIGARTIIEPSEKKQTIRELFDDIQVSDCYVSVLFCDYIGEFVFSISKEEDKNIYGGFDNLVVIDDSFSNANEFNDIIVELENRYSKFIENNKYSRVLGEWENFLEEDLIRISEINISISEADNFKHSYNE